MKHTFFNKIYIDSDTITVNISDSFVHKNLKTGNGSGETRLYVSQKKSSENRFFTFDNTRTISVSSGNRIAHYNPCPYKGVFLKANLLNYLNDSYTDYYFPAFNFNKGDITVFYNENLRLINELPDEIPFTIHNQNGKDDEFRFYIGSGDAIWHTVRGLVLPFTSEYTIHKMNTPNDETDIIYYFEVRKKGVDDKNNTLKKSFTPNCITDIEYTLLNKSSIISLDDLPYTSTNTLDHFDMDSTVELAATETNRTTVGRIGQAKFRDAVLSIMPQCPFTGISSPALLRASHIIPWKDCTDAKQRLDGYNGLALTPTYDLLFDYGLISFTNDGQLLVSSRLDKDICQALNLIAGTNYNIYNTCHQRDAYLEFHRTYVFNK